MTTKRLLPVLLSVISTRSNAVEAWLEATDLANVDACCAAYTAATRKIGRGALALTDAEKRDFESAAPEVVFDRWTLADAARTLLLLTAAERLEADAFLTLAIACLERGDAREQESWMRGVPLLPAPDRFLPLVIDACRTNVVPLFEAIACENPYPAAHFPERNFNQIVLKALFNSISIVRIVGLRRRMNPELARMAADYAAERRAAGRAVPADIGLAS